MPKSCIVCKAVASPDIQLQYCAQCQSAVYCSITCQRKDWRTQHKHICKLLNVGRGDMQVRTDNHTSRSINMKEQFEVRERSLDNDQKLFFKLFQESTFEGSQAAPRKMKKFAKRQTKHNRKFLSVGIILACHYVGSQLLSLCESCLLSLESFGSSLDRVSCCCWRRGSSTRPSCTYHRL
jgi:hypothetical protein